MQQRKIGLSTLKGKIGRTEMKNVMAGSSNVEMICYPGGPGPNCVAPGAPCYIEGQTNTTCRIEGGLWCCRKWW